MSKRFIKGFVIAFGAHVLITLILNMGTLLSRLDGRTACFVCENINAFWNSIGYFSASVISTLLCPYELTSRSLHSISLVASWGVRYLLAPVVFGLMWGYAFDNEKKVPERFVKVFLILYLPLWTITYYYLLNWYVSGFTESGHCPNLPSLFM